MFLWLCIDCVSIGTSVPCEVCFLCTPLGAVAEKEGKPKTEAKDLEYTWAESSDEKALLLWQRSAEEK